jgi:hypothetical protein
VVALLGLTLLGAVAARAQALCPNEQLRLENHSTALPDCRAYELVTPPFKYGQIATPTSATGISTDGASVLFDSIGGFAEAGNDAGTAGSGYVAHRGANGWSSVSLDPPAAQFEQAGAEANDPPDLSTDMGEALFIRAPEASSKPIDFRFGLFRSDGSLMEVGPAVPPSAVAGWTAAHAPAEGMPHIGYRGASADLAHIFFMSVPKAGSTFWLWPGDGTVPPPGGGQEKHGSLYEYSGTDNREPELVAVRNEGRLHGSPHLNEGAELISQCGAGLGNPKLDIGGFHSYDSYNAVSADGETVFFTPFQGGCEGEGPHGEVISSVPGPPVGELYVRLAREKTLDVSEPPLTGAGVVPGRSCSGVCQEDEEETGGRHRSEAVFQGASRNGSKVFFLTQQPLVNADEDSALDLYMAEIEGRGASARVSRLIQVSHDPHPGEPAEVQGVARVAEDGSRVYFVARGVLAGRNAAGGEPVKEADNLYVYDTRTAVTAFVATLSGEDSEDWHKHDGRPVEATPDGRYLLFGSVNDLTPDAYGAGGQLYRYDAQAERLIRVSIGQDGFNDNGNAGAYALMALQDFSTYSYAQPQGVSISDDGSKVFFGSWGGLTPQALNGVCALEANGVCRTDANNVYEWEQPGSGSCPPGQQAGCVYLLSDGLDTHAVLGGSTVTLLGANPSGSDVFITTADPLVPADGDGQMDIYDVRAAGGFPTPAQPFPCSGEVCQGAPSVAPSFGAPGSTALSGSGNLAAPRSVVAVPKRKAAVRCAKGRRRVHGRCVKASSRKKLTSRKAGNNRRVAR